MESMLEEFNMSALKSSPALRCERSEKDEKEMPASERKVYRQENCYGLTELTCAQCKLLARAMWDGENPQAMTTQGTGRGKVGKLDGALVDVTVRPYFYHL